MSTHPNVLLICLLTPNGTSRKTMREIVAEYGDPNGIELDDTDIKIAGTEYHTIVMESDYDDGYQISGKEGDLVFFDLVTYGYGEAVAWAALEKQKTDLETWAKEQCAKHGCTHEIRIGANYW